MASSVEWINQVTAPIFGVDLDGNITAWNKSIAEVSGYAQDEVLEKPLSCVSNKPRDAYMYFRNADSSESWSSEAKEDQAWLDDDLSSAVSAGNTIHARRLQIRTKTNETRTLLINTSPQTDASGKVIGILGVAVDATESLKKLTEEVDGLTNCIRFGTNANGIVDDWNYNAALITGYSECYALGKPLVSTFITQNLRPSVQEVIAKAVEGIETTKYVLEFMSKTQESLYLLISVIPRYHDSLIIGTTITGQDVTESMKREREMSSMARELRQLVNNANA